MKTTLVAGLSIVAVLSIAALAPERKSERIPDARLGLSKTSLFDAPAPEATLKNRTEPGERPPLERGFPGQPPLVPHGLDEYLPITLEDNQCADCHQVEEKVAGEPTPIPPSHYVDLRNAPDKTGGTIVGARYNCVTCHVAPGENPPLTGNTFGTSR